MIQNDCEVEIIKTLGINDKISKLLLSKDKSDILIGLELCSELANYEVIKAYVICNCWELSRELEDWWIKFGAAIWNENSHIFKNSIKF